MIRENRIFRIIVLFAEKYAILAKVPILDIFPILKLLFRR